MCNTTSVASSGDDNAKEFPIPVTSTSNKSNEENEEKSHGAPPKPIMNYTRLFDTNENWVLVDKGSFEGHFDYVPQCFREGPWNIGCCMYLAALVYWILLNCVECYSNPPPNLQSRSLSNYYGAYMYDTDAWQWWYNAAGFLWTMYIARGVVHSNMGWFAWTAYTLQSWTLIILRHGLCALAPFYPALVAWNESIRFAMLVQTTVVFFIWNFALLPAISLSIKSEKGRREFFKFCFGFLLSQLHIANLPLAALNGIWGSPARELNKLDFCVALALALQYVCFYLFVMDRIGMHFYFIFSPRSPLALISWTLFVGFHYLGFAMWNAIIRRYGTPL